MREKAGFYPVPTENHSLYGIAREEEKDLLGYFPGNPVIVTWNEETRAAFFRVKPFDYGIAYTQFYFC